MGDIERLKRAGDRLAHELMYREHSLILEEWWQARGGHAECSQCKPEAGTKPPTDCDEQVLHG